jgi:hypothetical protein
MNIDTDKPVIGYCKSIHLKDKDEILGCDKYFVVQTDMTLKFVTTKIGV